MKELKVSNPQKVLYPADNVTKLDVINYYIDVAKLMMPFVANRLLSVIRCHDDINQNCFFKKHPTNDKDMVKIKHLKNETYFYLDNIGQLIYQVQMGTLEFHIGASYIQKFNRPNIMVFDLDPDGDLNLNKLKDGVLKVKSILDQLQLKSFLKTSGGKGYHIVVPFTQAKNWQAFATFAEQIAKITEQSWPELFTTNIRKSERRGKIFIDYLRNSKNASCVAPYSLRARNGAPISFPMRWQDLNRIKPNTVTIKNYKQYLNNAWSNFPY